MTETNRIEFKRELTRELDIEKEVVALSPAFYIFADHLEIVSYGGLIDGMSKEELVSGCSRPRNREIMRIFKDVDLVEQLGTGMNRMMKAYTPDIFVVSPNFFHTVFNYNKLPENQEKDSSGLMPNNIQGVTDHVADNLTDRQRAILEMLKDVAENVAEKVAVNTKYLSERLGVNRKTIQRDVVVLQERQLIQWVGSDKTGHWEIILP